MHRIVPAEPLETQSIEIRSTRSGFMLILKVDTRNTRRLRTEIISVLLLGPVKKLAHDIFDSQSSDVDATDRKCHKVEMRGMG
jgi:hypothetical protein